MAIDKSLISGNTDMLILKLLEKQDMYGYQMIEELAKQSDHTFELKAGTLYPLLHLLEQKQYLVSYDGETVAGKTRKYYRITDEGKRFLVVRLSEWESYSAAVNKVLSGVFCLQEYNSPEEYIKDVQRYIRWSRAKVVATRELSDHINDQYDALRENGLNQKEAMRKAIEEMGDADVVGTELDIVHRPKVNWLLLLIAGVLLLSGILISAMLTSISLTVPKIIGIVLGVCVAAFLYFIDYTVLIRFPRALYGLLSLAAIFGLLYELWNGFAPLGYGFLFYLLLCYPIVLVGILFYEKNSESETKIIHYWLYAIFPLTLALINQAFPVFVLLLACELFIFCCGLKLKWLKWNRVNIFGVACMLIFLIIRVYLLSRFYHLFRLQENTGYLQQLDFFSVFREAELIGKSGMPVDVKVMSYFYDHPITLLLYEYGKFSLVFLLFVFGILFAILYRTSKKQDTEVGKLLTNTVLLIYILRIVFTALSDIGVLPNFFMCVPFVVTGGMFIIYDMALVGIILSVNRNESIAKDWIKLKSKRNAAKNGGQL